MTDIPVLGMHSLVEGVKGGSDRTPFIETVRLHVNSSLKAAQKILNTYEKFIERQLSIKFNFR